MSNSEIRILDLEYKYDLEDKNLIIVEDDEDTKYSTLYELGRYLSGDYESPDDSKFYSSLKVNDLISKCNISISSKASKKEIDELYDRITQITTNNPSGTKDQELIDARGSQSSLSNRFLYERGLVDDKYASKIRTSKSGTRLNLNDHKGYIDLDIDKVNSNSTGKVIISSKNIFNVDSSLTYDASITKLSNVNGFKYTQMINNHKTQITINFNEETISSYTLYAFSCDVSFSDSFIDKNAYFVVNYKDGTKAEYKYDHGISEVYTFYARKSFKSVTLKYDSNNFINNASVTFENVMIYRLSDVTDQWTEDPKYIDYHYEEIQVGASTASLYEIVNDDYIISTTIPNSTLTAKYYDHINTIEHLTAELNQLKDEFYSERDKCGLIENEGLFVPFNERKAHATNYPSSAEIAINRDIEYYRNGECGSVITINKDATTNPSYTLYTRFVDYDIESVNLTFYIDKTVFYNFTDNDGIRVHLSSDSVDVTITNYFTYVIKKSEMVQGWNNVKRNIKEFSKTGNPDSRNIQSVSVEIGRNDNLNGSSFIINGLTFNQRMVPTVILSFDGIYDDSISYLYPFLKARDIPASVLLNNSRTLTNQEYDYLIGLRTVNNWDIGTYGCNPNKELLTNDDNYRNQYIALKGSKEWITDNMVNTPVSYSAPYGNLRPITVPILKDLGYKIARTDSKGYISIFTEKDFAIPMHLISNETPFEEIKEKIDYAINNGVALSLYTRNVTEYGSEADATIMIFESVINYLLEKKNSIQCVTMKEFYDKCVNNKYVEDAYTITIPR